MRTLLLFLIIVAAERLSAQTILTDAKKLSTIFKNNAGKIVLDPGLTQLDSSSTTILRQYYPNKFKDVTDIKELKDNLEDAFKGNPFITIEITSQNQFRFSPISNTQAPKFPATTGFSVMTFADGFAGYLVNRTEQELSKAFLNNITKKILQEKNNLSFFCPITQAQLSVIHSEVFNFNDYLEALREGFIADMASLPGNTELFLKNKEYCRGCADKNEGKIMIDLLHVGQQMVNGESPINMIEYLAHPDFSAIQAAAKDTTNLEMFNIASGLRFLQLVSESLRDPSSDDQRKPWYPYRQLQAEFKDPEILRIYLGLLWQKSESISFVLPDSTKCSLRELMSSSQSVDMWYKSIESMGEWMQLIQFSLVKGEKAEMSVTDQFFTYSQAVTDLLLAVNKTGHLLLKFNDKDIIPIKYIFLMRQCNALYFNVRQRKYGAGLGNVIYCLSLLKEDADEKNKISEFLRSANFIAAIAEASSPEEINRAIESYALPPGSSEEKKYQGRFSVALNAYTGLALGWERLGQDQSSKVVGAISAPLGMNFSLGLGKSGSIGTFVPLIDVGAVTAYRFKDDNSGDLPELTWSNILSPGLYAIYSTPRNSPFAFGYGVQFGPGLRKVVETESGTKLNIEKSGWRKGFFLSVDIPITYFYLGKGSSVVTPKNRTVN